MLARVDSMSLPRAPGNHIVYVRVCVKIDDDLDKNFVFLLSSRINRTNCGYSIRSQLVFLQVLLELVGGFELMSGGNN